METLSSNFIFDFIDEDITPEGRFAGKQVHTRFPPEPNGYLHIGHAKALYINFEAAKRYHGLCNLRMDDTNPAKEDEEYVEAIQKDIEWLGYNWEDRFFYASDFFPQMYEFACELIRKNLAYICELNAEEVKQRRGDINSPATSPFRDRPWEESLNLFQRMKAGEFPDGTMTLRAKIDLASGNFNMRDPVLYRISHQIHHRTQDTWCIYPMYDYAHPLEDALEEITHSLCSLEFEAHRPLYDWVINNCAVPATPRQIEFARLGINYTVLSKRKLRTLIEENFVTGWDDPRMPTLCGLRRRGFTPTSIINFHQRNGISKVNSVVDYGFLEHCLREELNKTAPRVMAVLDPVKLIIENYPENQTEIFKIENNPESSADGVREVSFSRELWIERDDFKIEKSKKFFRLYPGGEVRLKSTYIITCTDFKADENGNIIEIYASYDPDSRGGNPPDGHKVKGTIHWVDAQTAVEGKVNLYDRLFVTAEPDLADCDFKQFINPHSLEIKHYAKFESSLNQAKPGQNYQFMRLGYFCLDCPNKADNTPRTLTFNRSVSLKDSFKE